MKRQPVNTFRLGLLVLAATICLVLGLYYIGKQKNIFHSSISLRSYFTNVNGLVPGNNVRFNGIDVGTVKEVFAVSDTAIEVHYTVDEETSIHIMKNAITS